MKFEMPEILVRKFAIEDVITVSGTNTGDNNKTPEETMEFE